MYLDALTLLEHTVLAITSDSYSDVLAEVLVRHGWADDHFSTPPTLPLLMADL